MTVGEKIDLLLGMADSPNVPTLFWNGKTVPMQFANFFERSNDEKQFFEQMGSCRLLGGVGVPLLNNVFAGV